jgi:hypothetical protein
MRTDNIKTYAWFDNEQYAVFFIEFLAVLVLAGLARI